MLTSTLGAVELDALTASTRATDLAEVAVDNWRQGKVDREWFLDWLVEAGQLAQQARAGRWPWLEERAA